MGCRSKIGIKGETCGVWGMFFEGRGVGKLCGLRVVRWCGVVCCGIFLGGGMGCCRLFGALGMLWGCFGE